MLHDDTAHDSVPLRVLTLFATDVHGVIQLLLNEQSPEYATVVELGVYVYPPELYAEQVL